MHIRHHGRFGAVPKNHLEFFGEIRLDGSVVDKDGVLIGGTASYVESLEKKILTERGKSTDDKNPTPNPRMLKGWPSEVFALPRGANSRQMALNQASKATSAKATSAESDTSEAKRGQLVRGLLSAGVSRFEADQVAALYLQQKSPSSAPPLPPR